MKVSLEWVQKKLGADTRGKRGVSSFEEFVKWNREVRSQERELGSEENFLKMGNRITHVYVI